MKMRVTIDDLEAWADSGLAFNGGGTEHLEELEAEAVRDYLAGRLSAAEARDADRWGKARGLPPYVPEEAR